MVNVQTSLMASEMFSSLQREKDGRCPEIVSWESVGFRIGLPGEVLGKDGNDFVLRKDLPLTQGALVTTLPKELRGEQSFCGLKTFLAVEVRRFYFADGTFLDIDCAHTAALQIDDSPVHVHSGWTNQPALQPLAETYEIISGEGSMVLDEKVVDVDPDSARLINIPPGVVHGLASKTPGTPVVAILSFRPAMAPMADPALPFRDEIGLQIGTRAAIEKLRLAI